jgi:hypothetical protein
MKERDSVTLLLIYKKLLAGADFPAVENYRRLEKCLKSSAQAGAA